MKKFFDPEPLIITNGGGGPGLFHDTIPNLKSAISYGSDAIRTNVAMTRDKKIVIFSNAVFQDKRFSDKSIGSLSLDELRSLLNDTASKKRGDKNREDTSGIFPELEEALSSFKDHRFNLHLSEKDTAIADGFCDIVRNLHAEERVLVSTLTGGSLKKIRGVFPDIATAFSFTGIMAFYALHRSGLLYFKRMFRDDVLITHEMIGASFIANPGLIREAKERGIRVYVLNVMKEDEVKRLFEAGVDGFVTNYAAMVKRAVPADEKKR